MLVLGSQVSQITQEVREFRFAKGKVCPHCGAEAIFRNGKYNVNNNIYVSLVKRPLLILLILLLIRARKH